MLFELQVEDIYTAEYTYLEYPPTGRRIGSEEAVNSVQGTADKW